MNLVHVSLYMLQTHCNKLVTILVYLRSKVTSEEDSVCSLVRKTKTTGGYDEMRKI